MIVEFRQNCEIQGQKFGHEKHMKPGIHEVPDSFAHDWYFKALKAEGLLKVLEEPKEVIEEPKEVIEEEKEVEQKKKGRR